MLPMPSSAKYTLVFAASLALMSCGGGGGGESAPPSVTAPTGPSATAPPSSAFSIGKASFFGGEVMPLNQVAPNAIKATLIFADGLQVELPIQPDGNLVAPVIPPERSKMSVKLSVSASVGVSESGEFTFELRPVATSVPGVTTLIYIDTALSNLSAGLDELQFIKVESPEVTEIKRRVATMHTLRAAIVAAQSGARLDFVTMANGTRMVLDEKQLQAFDQYVLAVLEVTGPSKSPMKASFGVGASAPMQLLVRPNCSGYSAADQGFCNNLRAQLLSDFLANSSGMAGTVLGGVGSGLAVLAAVGVATAATPAVVVGSVAISLVVAANVVGAGVQGISAYRTGTTQGTNLNGNIKNLLGVAQDAVVGRLALFLPRAGGGSDLLTELYDASAKFEVQTFLDGVERTFVPKTPEILPAPAPVEPLPSTPAPTLEPTPAPTPAPTQSPTPPPIAPPAAPLPTPELPPIVNLPLPTPELPPTPSTTPTPLPVTPNPAPIPAPTPLPTTPQPVSSNDGFNASGCLAPAPGTGIRIKNTCSYTIYYTYCIKQSTSVLFACGRSSPISGGLMDFGRGTSSLGAGNTTSLLDGSTGTGASVFACGKGPSGLEPFPFLTQIDPAMGVCR